MGCDIHSVIQIKREWDNRWKTVALDIGDNRNYNSFAVYADVRNGSGFAGCDTGEGWNPIASPRGLPKDFPVTEECVHGVELPEEQKAPMSQWMGNHSHSWLLLSEMLEKWKSLEGKQYEIHGYVDNDEYERTLAVGKPPTEWCGGTSRTDVVKAKWKVPAHERLYMMRNHIAIMDAIAKAEDLKPERVRLVFGFDS